jgi:hypothetical protein
MGMPELCRFYGIIISMFHNDHNPPHFHARYGNYKVTIKISDLTVMGGLLPKRAMALVIEWAFQNRDKLFGNWNALRERKPLTAIKPLK